MNISTRARDRTCVSFIGGILECSGCRSRRVYSVGDGVSLLALCTTGLNQRQGEVVCCRGGRYGVLLVGATEPVAVKPVNLHPIEKTPVFRDRPQEQTDGAAPLRWRFGEPTWSCANVATRAQSSSSSRVAGPRQPERREPAK